MDPRLEKILKLPGYARIALAAVLVVLIGVGYYFLFYSPKAEEYKNLRDDYQRLETKLIQDRRIANNLPKFKAEYEQMQKQLDQALAELPNKREIPTLLTSISSLAKEQGLEILRFQPLGEQKKDFYAEVPVRMSLVGPFHDVVLFFDQVGSLSRIVNISDLNISSQDENIRVEILATTFRFIETNQGK